MENGGSATGRAATRRVAVTASSAAPGGEGVARRHEAAFPALVPDESRWVERIRAGDEAAFNAMFRAYAAPLATFARIYLGSADDAADAVQDVFVNVWRRAATWECRQTVRGYLYAAVRNAALGQLKRGRARARATDRLSREIAGDLPGAPAHVVSPDDGHDAHEAQAAHEARMAAFERALAALSDKHRQVFLLRWQHGLTYAEIAGVLEIPVKTVDSRMVRALQAMRRVCLL
jgi:RNA polymerase sigma-70 factor (ECF subfamily)